jgi:hypothetical protein
MQQMTVDMKQIGIVADATDDVLVPDFGQQGSARRLHCRILPFFLFLWQVDAPPPGRFARARQSGLQPEQATVIKTYRRAWANVSFGGPDPTPARNAVASSRQHKSIPCIFMPTLLRHFRESWRHGICFVHDSDYAGFAPARGKGDTYDSSGND